MAAGMAGLLSPRRSSDHPSPPNPIGCPTPSSKSTSQSYFLGTWQLEVPYMVKRVRGTADPDRGHWQGSHYSEMSAVPQGTEAEGRKPRRSFAESPATFAESLWVGPRKEARSGLVSTSLPTGHTQGFAATSTSLGQGHPKTPTSRSPGYGAGSGGGWRRSERVYKHSSWPA